MEDLYNTIDTFLVYQGFMRDTGQCHFLKSINPYIDLTKSL